MVAIQSAIATTHKKKTIPEKDSARQALFFFCQSPLKHSAATSATLTTPNSGSFTRNPSPTQNPNTPLER